MSETFYDVCKASLTSSDDSEKLIECISNASEDVSLASCFVAEIKLCFNVYLYSPSPTLNLGH
jgi:hypothetical protein